MGKQKVGVLLPVKSDLTRQEQEWLDLCIESIGKQTYKNTHYYTLQSDYGIAYNINACAYTAIKENCDLLFVMSADDWLEPNCVEEVVNVYNLDPTVGFVTCSIRYEPSKQVHRVAENVTYEKQLDHNQMVGFALYPIQLWHEFGGYSEHFSDITKASLEDYDLQTRIMKHYKYSVLKEPLVNYRIHAEQTTNKISNQQAKLQKRFKILYGA